MSIEKNVLDSQQSFLSSQQRDYVQTSIDLPDSVLGKLVPVLDSGGFFEKLPTKHRQVEVY